MCWQNESLQFYTLPVNNTKQRRHCTRYWWLTIMTNEKDNCAKTCQQINNTSDSCFSACKHFRSSCFVLVFSASSSAVNSRTCFDNSTILVAAGALPPAPAACTISLSCSFFRTRRRSNSRSLSSLKSRPFSSFNSLTTQTKQTPTEMAKMKPLSNQFH